jgi:hypothetical protein
MAWFQCPTCGARGHLGVTDGEEEWHRTHWPNHSRTDLLPIQCPMCSIELKPGDRVAVRVLPAGLASRLKVGTTGVVTAIESGQPSTYRVSFKWPRSAASFQRSELSLNFPESPPMWAAGWVGRVVRSCWRWALGICAAGLVIGLIGLAFDEPRLIALACWLWAPWAIGLFLIMVLLEASFLILIAGVILDAVRAMTSSVPPRPST